MVVGLAFLSCVYKPEVPDGVLRCDQYQRCPAGYICNAIRDGELVTLVCCHSIGCGDRLGNGPAAPGPDASVKPPVDGAADLRRAANGTLDGPWDAAGRQ
jgi:hypothetical protein